MKSSIFKLFAAGVIVHSTILVIVDQRMGRLDCFAFQSLDAQEYYQIAKNWAEHGSFSQDDYPPLTSDTWRTPGYPAFLAIIIKLFGSSPITLILAQQWLALLQPLQLYQIARRSMTDRKALLCGLLFLIEPYHQLYALWLLSTTWFVTALLLAWDLWSKTQSQKHLVLWLSLGIVCGILILIWPLAILIPPATILATLLQRHNLPSIPRKKVTIMAFLVAGCLLPPIAWMGRNARTVGHWSLSHQSGIVLAYFKATEVILWRMDRTQDRYLETSLNPSQALMPHTVWDDIDARLRNHFPNIPPAQQNSLRWENLAQGNKTFLDSFDISLALQSIGWRYLIEKPFDTAMCCLARIGENLLFPFHLAVQTYTGLAPTPRWRHGLLAIAYATLMMVVLVRLIRGCRNFQATCFPWMITAAILLVATPQVDPRFRVPIIPFLLFIACLPPRPLHTPHTPIPLLYQS